MWRVEKNTEYISKTFRLPLELVNRMEEAAAINGVSLNKFVFQSLNYAMANLDSSEEEPVQEARGSVANPKDD